ncbi:hypothetical protein PsorP6_015814 [Peronosclerospora sorghi]|uniref:Uncharacterized protein n=1 Tax=Peronosclerospora sorghi TaxID=230839 RepID=A0ACC0WMP3_9STRA|nr:hypothetical protein PsorP6_015814 [Peronosclerospora sorghi]
MQQQYLNCSGWKSPSERVHPSEDQLAHGQDVETAVEGDGMAVGKDELGLAEDELELAEDDLALQQGGEILNGPKSATLCTQVVVLDQTVAQMARDENEIHVGEDDRALGVVEVALG